MTDACAPGWTSVPIVGSGRREGGRNAGNRVKVHVYLTDVPKWLEMRAVVKCQNGGGSSQR